MDIPTNGVKNDKRYQVEQQDSYLIDHNPYVVSGVELFVGQTKPFTMNADNAIVSKTQRPGTMATIFLN